MQHIISEPPTIEELEIIIEGAKAIGFGYDAEGQLRGNIPASTVSLMEEMLTKTADPEYLAHRYGYADDWQIVKATLDEFSRPSQELYEIGLIVTGQLDQELPEPERRWHLKEEYGPVRGELAETKRDISEWWDKQKQNINEWVEDIQTFVREHAPDPWPDQPNTSTKPDIHMEATEVTPPLDTPPSTSPSPPASRFKS